MAEESTARHPGTGAFVAGSRWEDIPPEVRHEGVRGLLNFVGCALGGCRDEAIDLAVAVLAPSFGPAQASLIGRAERPDMLNAAFLNAAAANVLEYDDTHLCDRDAPGGAGRARRAGAGRARPVAGRDAAACADPRHRDVCRVGVGLMPTHYRRGWHITATCGMFGAAAACRQAARPRRAAHGVVARPCRDPIGRAGREPRQHVEEPRGRQRGAQRTRRRAVRRGRFHRRRAGDRGALRLRRGRPATRPISR